ncbi:MAG TPA: hypothetical protein VFH58_10675 [Acidimicrobiales bacterium]|nr:hypothetical protein [Acidimicrobiales bacterium]
MRDPSDYSAEFADYLRSLGGEVALIGAMAALRYRSHPRETTDVDFLIRDMGELPARLEADGYEVKALIEPGDTDPYLLLIRGNGIRVDVMAALTEFQLSALDRAVDGTVTAEDVIVFKLLAWRPRDRADIASILAAGHSLDEEYIAHWAAEWLVTDRWDQARRE